MAENNKRNFVDASPFVIDYNELLDTAMVEYMRVLLRVLHPVQIRRKDETEPKYSVVEYREMEISLPTGRVQRQVHACAATFILPSIIEHNLLLYLENTVIAQWMTGMVGKKLDSDEAALYQQFLDMKKRLWYHDWGQEDDHGAYLEDGCQVQRFCGRSLYEGNPLWSRWWL